MNPIKPLLLVILDGFGISKAVAGNPVKEAKTPNLDHIQKNFPITLLAASEVAVGLPWGEAGNSEVGHLTMGAGRVIYHHLPRIINAISDGSFFENPALKKAAEHTRQNKSRLHIAGLVSSGSVHSYIDHLYALLEFSKQEKLVPVFLHLFSDGKDAPPKEGADFYTKLEERLKAEYPAVRIASVIGRKYALDRSQKWDLVETAYRHLTEGRGEKITSVPEYLNACYQKEITDEFIEPANIIDSQGLPAGKIQENDALIFSDFREDSIREITHAFADENFDKFSREKIKNLLVVTLTEYENGMDATPAFPRLDINWPLGRVLSEAGLSQLRIAETQKYAHVTYFFNGGVEEPFPGEKRILIQSLDTAPDKAPEMKAEEITKNIIENLNGFDIIIANFANADMVGHAENFEAAVHAAEVLDESIGNLVNTVLNGEGIMIVTGDHGNLELARNLMTGENLTEHSINPVPFYLIANQFRLTAPRAPEEIQTLLSGATGILTDVAPTMIELLGLEKPQEMTGKSLLTILKAQLQR